MPRRVFEVESLLCGTCGDEISPLSGLGGGFGIKMAKYRADYTFTPFGPLGNTQRLSLGARF